MSKATAASNKSILKSPMMRCLALPSGEWQT
jgi:hypothetical protein